MGSWQEVLKVVVTIAALVGIILALVWGCFCIDDWAKQRTFERALTMAKAGYIMTQGGDIVPYTVTGADTTAFKAYGDWKLGSWW